MSSAGAVRKAHCPPPLGIKLPFSRIVTNVYRFYCFYQNLAIRQESLKNAKLPSDIAAFAPFQDRMTIVQDLQGRHDACSSGALI